MGGGYKINKMEFIFLLHSQLTGQDLERIISLKKTHWDYSTEEHKNWIENNIYDNDIHVLMIEKNTLVGYMNLVKVEVILNDKLKPFLGIGNVCTLKKRSGYGKKLVIEVQEYLFKNNYGGILFCKDDLINFYSKYNWTLLDVNKIKSRKFKNANIMVTNLNYSVINLEYDGRSF